MSPRTGVNTLVGLMALAVVAKAGYEGWWRRDTWIGWDAGLQWVASKIKAEEQFENGVKVKLMDRAVPDGLLNLVVPRNEGGTVVTIEDEGNRRVIAKAYVRASEGEQSTVVQVRGIGHGSFRVKATEGRKWYGEAVGFGSSERELGKPVKVEIGTDGVATVGLVR